MATAATQAPGRRGNKFPSLRSPVTWVVVLGIGLAAGAYILYRRNKANAAAATTTTTAATPNNEDVAGQIATLQGEIADLQSTGAQDEGAETGTGSGGGSGGGGGGGGGKLTAPAGLSITPHAGYADFGWSKVDGAKAYELQVAGTAPHPGASHYDHAGSDNHAEKVRLANGNYHARVRAGTSTASLTGPWTDWKDFHVGGLRGTPIKGTPVTSRAGSNGSGESENDTGSG